MPLYQLKCTECGNLSQIWRKVDERDNLPECVCTGLQHRVIAAPRLVVEIEPYISPGTGAIINSRTQRREDLLRSGAILHEPGLERDIARNRESVKEKAFAPIARAVDDQISALVAAGKIES